MKKLEKDFYLKDVLEVAPQLIGNQLCLKSEGKVVKHVITEVEAYRGEEDEACHASKGRTARTEIMYHDGGFVYVYLIYGIYWMLNVVTGKKNEPQAVLIRGLKDCSGPGRVGKLLNLDKSFYGENLVASDRIWIEDKPLINNPIIKTSVRIGIEYAGVTWKNKPWRFEIG
jgi:DNA-3-methyladenine glycosylase